MNVQDTGEKDSLPVTAVIPHRNRYNELKRCVDSIFILNRAPQAILIIDDTSDAEVLAQIRQNICYPNVRIISLRIRLGRAESKNIGLALCQTPYIWFLDSDTEIINPQSLEFGYRQLKSSSNLAAIGGELVKDMAGRTLLRETVLSANYSTLNRHYFVKQALLLDVQTVPTNNFLGKTGALQEIGGFCPLLDVGEDKLLSLSLIAQGYKLLFSSFFGVLHYYSPAARTTRERHWDEYISNNAFIYGTTANFPKLVLFSCYNLVSIAEELLHKLRIRLKKKEFKFKSSFNDDVQRDCAKQGAWAKLWNILKRYYKSNNYIMLAKGIKYRFTNRSWDDFVNNRFPAIKKIMIYE